MPAASAATPAPVAKVAAGQSVYKVRPGDTLSGVARDQMGNLRRWAEIWEANRNRIADPVFQAGAAAFIGTLLDHPTDSHRYFVPYHGEPLPAAKGSGET